MLWKQTAVPHYVPDVSDSAPPAQSLFRFETGHSIAHERRDNFDRIPGIFFLFPWVTAARECVCYAKTGLGMSAFIPAVS